MLEAWEVMNLDLREEVVVLSACEMARGAIGEGEGLLGMSWAMFVAGAAHHGGQPVESGRRQHIRFDDRISPGPAREHDAQDTNFQGRSAPTGDPGDSGQGGIPPPLLLGRFRHIG